MCQRKCWGCSETFSLTMVAGKTDYTFKQGLNPDGKHVRGILVRRQNAATTAKDIDRNVLTPDAVLAAAFLKVSTQGNKEVVKYIPLNFLAFSSSCCEPFCVNWNPIEFNNTAVKLDPTATGFAAGQVIEFTVFYDCPDLCQ